MSNMMTLTLLTGIVASAAISRPLGPPDPHSGEMRDWIVSETLEIHELRPGVWMHTSRRPLADGVLFPANGLLVRDGDALVLVDTAWGTEATEELLGWIERDLGLPVRLAIVSHVHEDSMGDTAVLAARRIPVLGHELTLELAMRRGVPVPESVGRLQAGDTVQLGDIELFYPGPNHSADALVVWIPEAKVLFGGCGVRSPRYFGKGNTADADLAEWPRAIGRVRDRYPEVEVVVPGHGPPGDAGLLAHTIALFGDDDE